MSFKVGEIAVLCNTTHFKEYEGQDCEITSLLVPRQTLCMNSMEQRVKMSYGILMMDGMKLNAAPHQLRKKEPPKKDEAHERREALTAT